MKNKERVQLFWPATPVHADHVLTRKVFLSSATFATPTTVMIILSAVVSC